MRVLYTHLYQASYGVGGAEKVILDLASAMCSRYGLEAACAVNPSPFAESLKEAGASVWPIEWSKARTLRTVKVLKQAVHDFKPDLIHSHHRYTTFLSDILFKDTCPVLHTEHVLRRDRRWLFRSGTCVSAVHSTVADNLHKWFKVPRSKIQTIPNAVPVPRVKENALHRIQKHYSRREGDVFAVCVGRLEEQKGHVYLLEALSRITEEKRRRLKVFLAGDGSLEASLRQAGEEKGLGSCLVFLGHTPDVPEYLALCDLFVLPSLYEGMPLSVLEAMSAGLAVVATDIPGTREIVDPSCGVLVPARDPAALAAALEHALDDPERIRGMGRQALDKWAKEYSFEKMVSSYYDLYRKMIT